MIHIKENREGEGRGKIKLEIHFDKIFQMECSIKGCTRLNQQKIC